jgi:hypothetical protein
VAVSFEHVFEFLIVLRWREGIRYRRGGFFASGIVPKHAVNGFPGEWTRGNECGTI